MDKVTKFFFMPTVLDYLSRGALFRTVIGRILQFGGAAFGLVGTLGWLKLLVSAFDAVPAKGILGLLVFMLALLGVVYVIAHTLWIRGKEIAGGADSEIVVLPIVIKLIRTCGDIGATCLVIVGIAGCLGSWLAFGALSDLPVAIPGMSGGNFVIAGITVLITCSLMAFGCALVFYLYAEIFNLVVSMAQNLEILAKASGGAPAAAAPAAAAPSSGGYGGGDSEPPTAP